MAKFKEAGNGQFVRYSTDENGNKIPGTETATFSESNKPKTSGAGLWREKIEWEAKGNVVEPQFTAEQLAAKEAEETEAAKVAYKGLRKSAYDAAGLTFEAWTELVIEKNTAGQTAFRAARDIIRAEIPKPE